MPEVEMQLTEHDFDIMKTYKADNTWLACIDLIDVNGQCEVEIEKVYQVKNATFEKGRTQSGQALKFKGAKKMLFLNATNTETLHRKFGTGEPKKCPASELIGKRIRIVVEKLPRDFNGHKYGLRIK